MNNHRNLILVGGGARSGKSRFALARACALGPRRIFVATAEALDAEMAIRIARHREERGATFETVEAPLALAETLEAVAAADSTGLPAVIVVDCLTLWVSNLLVGGATPSGISTAFDQLQGALERRRTPIILVTNEVGLGLVPETPLGRSFRDAIGALHQRLAARADEIYLAVMGLVLRLHPAPVAVAPSPAGSTDEP